MIFIVRHGETISNKERFVQGQTDIELSNEGREKVKLFAKEFKKLNIKFDSFYSSPLSRAKETLDIIMNELRETKEAIIVDSLKERYFGEAEGIKYDSKIVAHRISTDYYKGMEKNEELENRVYNGILNIMKDNIDRNVLIVSHSHAIKAFIKCIKKDYTYENPTKNLNINIFDFDGENFKIIEINKDLI